MSMEGGAHQVQGPPLSEQGELEYPMKPADSAVSDGNRGSQGDGEASEQGRMTSGPLLLENQPPVLEHGLCRHPPTALLAAGMALDDVVQVERAAGCGQWLYASARRWLYRRP